MFWHSGALSARQWRREGLWCLGLGRRSSCRLSLPRRSQLTRVCGAPQRASDRAPAEDEFGGRILRAVKHLNDCMQAENLFISLEMPPSPWKVLHGAYAPLCPRRYWPKR